MILLSLREICLYVFEVLTRHEPGLGYGQVVNVGDTNLTVFLLR